MTQLIVRWNHKFAKAAIRELIWYKIYYWFVEDTPVNNKVKPRVHNGNCLHGTTHTSQMISRMAARGLVQLKWLYLVDCQMFGLNMIIPQTRTHKHSHMYDLVGWWGARGRIRGHCCKQRILYGFDIMTNCQTGKLADSSMGQQHMLASGASNYVLTVRSIRCGPWNAIYLSTVQTEQHDPDRLWSSAMCALELSTSYVVRESVWIN